MSTGDATTPIARGRQAFQQGDLTTTLTVAQQQLQHNSEDIDALELLFLVYHKKKQSKQAIDTLARIVQIDPNLDWAYNDMVRLLSSLGQYQQAEQIARRALRINPDNGEVHDLFGVILSESNNLPAGEWHFKRALTMVGSQAVIHTHLALNLMQQGRTDEAETHYRKADALQPNDANILAHWSKLCEVSGDLQRAEALLQRAEQASSPRQVDLLRAGYLARHGQYQQALAIVDRGDAINGHGQLERGRLYDRLQRYDEAWRDFTEGKNKLAVENGNPRYDKAAVSRFFTQLKQFFVADNCRLLPYAEVRDELPQPIFIFGFPRSGTTLIEQVLSAHPLIRAGGELPFADALRHLSGLLLPGEPFPDNLAQSWTADHRYVATLLRDYYHARAEQYGLHDSESCFFTDKMPFNEVYLPLLRMAFPKARIVHLIRHPLDVCVSMMANHLTHGFNCGYRIEDIVHHLAAVFDLYQHYRKQQLTDDVLTLRYETFVDHQREQTEQLLQYLHLPFDSACLNFHQSRRYAPTPSYAQVAQPLNRHSVARHKHYIAYLEPLMQVLEPMMSAYDYTT